MRDIYKKNAAELKRGSMRYRRHGKRAALGCQTVEDLRTANSAAPHACGGKGGHGLSGVSRRRARGHGQAGASITPRQLLLPHGEPFPTNQDRRRG